MKKTISILLCLVVFLSNLLVPVLASETITIIPQENGDYIEVEIIYLPTRASTSSTKTYTYKDSSGVAQWKALLSGTFTYNGTTSSCTNSTVGVTIYNDAWYMVSKSATKSGSAAYGTVTMGHKVLGATTSQKTYNLFLICDKDGNLS